MRERAVVVMANRYRTRKNFYGEFYKDCKLFESIKDIPIVTKTDLLYYETLHSEPWWSPCQEAVDIITAIDAIKAATPTTVDVAAYREAKEAVVVEERAPMLETTTGTSGAVLEFPAVGQKEIWITFDSLFKQPIWVQYFGTAMPYFVTSEAFDMTQLSTGHQKEYRCSTDHYAYQDYALTVAQIEKAGTAPIAFLGDPVWLAWAIRKGLIQSSDKHWVIVMPKATRGWISDDVIWDGINQLKIFVSCEVGIYGYYTSKCSVQKYHLYRENQGLHTEEVNGELVISMWRQIFPFVRYNQGDRVAITTETCSCGFSGKMLEKL